MSGNIGPRGRSRRMVAGVLLLMMTAGAVAGLFVLRLHPLWRLTLAVPLWIGIIDVWQAATSC